MTKLQFSRLLYSIAALMNDRPIGIERVKVAKIDADRVIRSNNPILGRSTFDVTPLYSQMSNLVYVASLNTLSTGVKTRPS